MRMKKYYIFLLTITFSVHFYAQIPNASFENWTGNYPDGWTSRLFGSPYNLISQNSTAHLGSYALKSTHLNVASQTYIYDGIYTGNQSTNFYVPNGNIKPTMLLGWYNLTNNADSFTVDIKFKNNGFLIGAGTFATKANTVGYSPFVVNINYTSSAVPDSFYIGISWNHCTIASNGTCNTSQTWGDVIVDDLSFSTQLGVNELNNSINNIILFPNPSSLILTIQTEEDITSLAIYNTIGEVCNYKPLDAKSIDISGLSSGVYYLEVKTTKGLVHKKFVKE